MLSLPFQLVFPVHTLAFPGGAIKIAQGFFCQVFNSNLAIFASKHDERMLHNLSVTSRVENSAETIL
jgi:hypothetical protein